MPNYEKELFLSLSVKKPSEKLFTPRPCKNGGNKEDCDVLQTVIGDPACDECLENLQKQLIESAIRIMRSDDYLG